MVALMCLDYLEEQSIESVADCHCVRDGEMADARQWQAMPGQQNVCLPQ